MPQLIRTTVLSCLLVICIGNVVAQDKLTTEQQVKVAKASRVAAQFVEYFRKTLDFEKAWNRFKASDTRCSYRLVPQLPQFSNLDIQEKPFDQRLSEIGIDEPFIQRLFSSGWNSALLYQSYVYSYSPWNGLEPDIEKTSVPKGRVGREILKVLRLIGSDKSENVEPTTRKSIEKALSLSNASAKVLRRYMPRDVLKTRAWYSAEKWFGDVHKVGGGVMDQQDFKLRCPWVRTQPLYVSQIGFFVLVLTEEQGKMKLWAMEYVSD